MIMLGSLILLGVCGSTVTAQFCNPGWELNGPSCYKVSSDSHTWLEAMKMCQHDGAILANIETIDEQVFVGGLLSKVQKNHSYWIGAEDWESEGRWLWKPKGIAMDFTNWHDGSPNNKGNIEDCLVIDSSSGNKWDDRKCHSQHKYICEMPRLSNSPN